MKQAFLARGLSLVVLTTAGALLAPTARADAVTDWNTRAGEIIAESRLGTPPAIRVMALVQTAVESAVEAAELRAAKSAAERAAALDAAVAAANRVALLKLVPAQQAMVESMYRAALGGIADGAAKEAGIAAGEAAAAKVLAARASDTIAPGSYRPLTVAGAYVPTAAPAVPTWSQRRPWLMASAGQFRPGPPPALGSAAWARDFGETQLLGGRTSERRSAEQTEIARFWEYSLPAIYFGVVRSAADAPGRELIRNARLYAAVAQAMDDAMIAVFDAKYHYNFWRPVTAIRNADLDGNDATERDANWVSLIESPMHPEYPSGHSILAAAVGTVLQAETGKLPALATTSPSAKGVTRRWTGVEPFVQEVSNARVYAGIHFRSATEAGEAMGRRIGELAARRASGQH